MQFTNKFNLPSPLVSALTYDNYFQPGHIGVTSLISSPRIYQLRKRHDDKITEDVSDRIWILFGSAIHSVLERAVVIEGIQEERLSIDVNGWKVTGKADLWEAPGILSDWKITSVWTGINGEVKPEWEQQLNAYSLLYQKATFPVEQLQIVCLYRDWSKNRAKREQNYPQCPVQIFKIIQFDKESVLEIMTNRVELHQQAEKLSDDELPFCTSEERWEKPTTYAVMKKGRKRAVRLLENKKDAEKWLSEGKGDKIEVRLGESTRCISYCPVKKFCNQYNEIKKKGEK